MTTKMMGKWDQQVMFKNFQKAEAAIQAAASALAGIRPVSTTFENREDYDAALENYACRVRTLEELAEQVASDRFELFPNGPGASAAAPAAA